jgi:carboxypeptidase Taq
VLAELREALVPLVAEIAESGKQPDVSIVARRYPVDVQEKFSKLASAAIGFDYARGRVDTTAHPFCTGLGPNDCRITTRYEERFFNSAFFGTLHEAGHGIYDQGLRAEWYGLPPGEAISLGIHESQSRMWENLVGRSRAFWRHFYPQAQKLFPEALSDVSLDAFYFAINDVRPSLVRVEADEATYNLHILIRFELEQALLADEIPIADVPAAWNDKYQEYLGIRPPSAADGVLQDVHWSAGLVGYFPTYSLGNLYASQFFETADRELGGLDEQFARGEFEPLKDWLGGKIHRHGQCYSAAELVEKVTGKTLSPAPLMAHLRAKLAPLYGLN